MLRAVVEAFAEFEPSLPSPIDLAKEFPHVDWKNVPPSPIAAGGEEDDIIPLGTVIEEGFEWEDPIRKTWHPVEQRLIGQKYIREETRVRRRRVAPRYRAEEEIDALKAQVVMLRKNIVRYHSYIEQHWSRMMFPSFLAEIVEESLEVRESGKHGEVGRG